MIDSVTRPAVAEITKAVVSPAAVASGHHGISRLRRGIFLRLTYWISTSAVFVMRCRCSGDIPEHWPSRKSFALVWLAMKRVTALALLAIASAVPSGCRGSDSPQRTSQNRLITLGYSIGGIRLGEARRSVEEALGPGTSRRRGLVWYFGGRLRVDYWFHDGLTTRVEGLETKWGGFHTRSGVHVGSSREELRVLHVACRDGKCWRAAGRMPDAPGTLFTMRHGKVAQIDVFYS